MALIEISSELYDELLRDSERLSWLEETAKESYSGLTINFLKGRDAAPLAPGYRLMRFRKVFDTKPTLRAAIDNAMGE